MIAQQKGRILFVQTIRSKRRSKTQMNHFSGSDSSITFGVPKIGDPIFPFYFAAFCGRLTTIAP
jgi:hypothetical protein